MKQWVITTEEVRRYRVQYLVEAKNADEARDKFETHCDSQWEEFITTISQKIIRVDDEK